MSDEQPRSVDPPRRKERQDSENEEWKENPQEQYFSENIEEDNIQRVIDRVRDVFKDFTAHLEENVDLDDMELREVCEQDVNSFVNEMLDPDPNKSDKTIERYLIHLQAFYNELQDNSAIGDNPVSEPLKQFRADDDRELDSPDRPYIPFDHMEEYVNWITDPLERALSVQGLKHGTRSSETINIDLRCLNIDHPIFDEIIERHDVDLDPRVRNRKDSLIIYESFTEGTEIPNEQTPGNETEGEIRYKAAGNKRKEDGGSVLPIDSELKTALIEWLLVRPPTYSKKIHPLFTVGASDTRRIDYDDMANKLWRGPYEKHTDSINEFGKERSLNNCPKCGRSVVEENFEYADKTGRRYYCDHCQETHWRTITWENGLETPQKVTFHQFRHYFSDAHRAGKSKIHDSVIPEDVRKKRIRGDKEKDQDTDDRVYSDKQYQDWEEDVRKPYLDAIYKFNIYDNPIPAVGEGWNQ